MKQVRRYPAYADYLEHQPKKLDAIPKFRRGLVKDREGRIGWFQERFRQLPLCLGTVLCLGARLGEEVEAFRSLGFTGAIGLDLKEYPPLVVAGDMNRLNDWDDASVDMVYSNAIDHCWEPAAFVREILRVLKPGGLVVLHLAFGEGLYETWVPDSAAEVVLLFPGCTIVTDQSTDPPMYSLAHELVLRKP